ncbi:MAG: T9SS type A sorting domain-containing protein [Candidatus Cloacimonetes bacterium]|nr:T9SS type A sorting domain-containing protein [Candidatus Cloacimonadota bacterium]
MRRTGLFFLLFALGIGSLMAASPWITLDHVGLHGAGGTSDFSASPSEAIYITAQYDTDSGAPAMDNVTSCYYTTVNTGKVVIYWYNGADPNTSTYLGSSNTTVANVTQGGIGSNRTFTCDFTLPSAPSSALSFQVFFGLYGDDVDFDTQYGTRYTSYITRNTYNPPAGSPAAGWQKYMAYAADTSTQTPTITKPVNGSRDNVTIDVEFNLPEAASSGTVKLYINNTSDVNQATLTLTSTYETSGNHSFTLDGSDLDAAAAVASGTGIANLTNGTAYRFVIGYQDAVPNTEATSSTTNQMTYDTAALAVNTISGENHATNTGHVNAGYTLQEDADDLWLIFYDNDASLTRARLQVRSAYGSTYLTGARTITDLDGSDFNNDIGDQLVAIDGSFFASLVDGHNYAVKIEYDDLAGNTITSVSPSTFNYLNDTSTQTPTAPTVDEAYNSTDGGPALTCGYNLPEAGSIVDVVIDDDATHPAAGSEVAGTNVQCIVSLNGETASGAHSFILSVPFVTADNGGDGDQVTSVTGTASLTDGVTYYYAVRYKDASGNDYARTTWQSFVWDGATQTPTITAPSASSYQNDTITFTFNLPETGSTGSVQILFDDDANHAAVYETMTFVNDESSGGHTVTLETMSTNIANNAEITTSSPNNALNDNSGQPEEYYVAVRYQDDDGNPAATSVWHTFYFDESTLAINLDLPVVDETITGNFTIQYDLQETALAGNNGLYVKFVCTSAAETDRTFAISSHASGTNIAISNVDPTNIGGHASLSLFGLGSTGLTLGETYTVSIHTQDLAGNAAQSNSHTGVIYDTSTAVVTVGNIALANEPLAGPSATNQHLIRFSLVANSAQTADMTALSFAFSGSAATGDFPANAFDLWEDTNNDGSPNTQIWSSVSFASPVAFSGSAITITDSPRYFIVHCDLDATIDETHTIRLTLNESGVTSDAASYNSFPIQGRSHYLDGYVTEVAGGGTGNGVILPGTEEAVLWWYLTANQGTCPFTAVDVEMTVDAWTDIDAVHLYSNTSNTLTGATLLDSDSSPGPGSTITFSPGVNVPTTRTYYLVSVEVAAGAPLNHTAQAEVTAASDMTFTAPFAFKTTISGVFPITGDEHPLPVELSSYQISNNARTVTLAWVTETETENAGFNLYRGLSLDALETEQAILLTPNMIAGAVNSTEPVEYSYEDEYRIGYDITYYYWLEAIDLNGTSGYFAAWPFTPEQPGGNNGAPEFVQYGLHQNYPNPFNPETTISFVMKLDGPTTLDIYNVKGQLVRRVFNENTTADQRYRIVWDGHDTNGSGVGSGIYFYRLTQGSFVETKQMILMR